MNLYQKLVKIRQSTPYIQKDSTNQFHRFKYTSSSAVLSTLRKSMDEHGVLLIPEIEEFTVNDHTTAKGKHEYFTLLKMVFTWVNSENPDEKIKCPWHGQGLDDAEKGLGKALTYAEKFFLLKFFNIATDETDPDAFGRKQNQGNRQPQNNRPAAPQAPRKSPQEIYKTLIGRCDTVKKWADAQEWMQKQPWCNQDFMQLIETDFNNWRSINQAPPENQETTNKGDYNYGK